MRYAVQSKVTDSNKLLTRYATAREPTFLFSVVFLGATLSLRFLHSPANLSAGAAVDNGQWLR
jgi:hypothetical protein